MNLSMGGILFMAVVIFLSEGCGAHKRFPESSLTGGVYELKIDSALTPQSVAAKRRSHPNHGSAAIGATWRSNWANTAKSGISGPPRSHPAKALPAM